MILEVLEVLLEVLEVLLEVLEVRLKVLGGAPGGPGGAPGGPGGPHGHPKNDQICKKITKCMLCRLTSTQSDDESLQRASVIHSMCG